MSEGALPELASCFTSYVRGFAITWNSSFTCTQPSTNTRHMVNFRPLASLLQRYSNEPGEPTAKTMFPKERMQIALPHHASAARTHCAEYG